MAERWSEDPAKDRQARTVMWQARDWAEQRGEAFVVFIGSLPAMFGGSSAGEGQYAARRVQENGAKDVTLKRFGAGWFSVPGPKV